MITPKKTCWWVAVPYPEFFRGYWYMYWDRKFNKIIGVHTVRQGDRRKL